MRLSLSGSNIPKSAFDMAASLTDGARLRYADVTHDPRAGEVHLPMTRYPLIKQRNLLPNVRDSDNPISTVLHVRKVVRCDIEDNTARDYGQHVQLIFGVRIEDGQVYACSAEEDRGQPLYSITLEISEIDIEIADAEEKSV